MLKPGFTFRLRYTWGLPHTNFKAKAKKGFKRDWWPKTYKYESWWRNE